jgi:hypothetical protein
MVPLPDRVLSIWIQCSRLLREQPLVAGFDRPAEKPRHGVVQTATANHNHHRLAWIPQSDRCCEKIPAWWSPRRRGATRDGRARLEDDRPWRYKWRANGSWQELWQSRFRRHQQSANKETQLFTACRKSAVGLAADVNNRDTEIEDYES